MTHNNQNNDKGISTELSLSPHISMTNDTYDYYAEQYKNLPKMKKDSVSIHGVELSQGQQNELIVKAFIRSSIEKPVRLKPTSIVLLNQNEVVIANRMVDFTHLGVLPPNTSRPWQFVFPEENVFKHNKDQLAGWFLDFGRSREHKLDLTDKERDAISEFSQAKLQKIVQQAPSLEEDELSFMGLSAKQKESGELVTTLLIRNGTKRDLKIKQIPLKLYDAQKELSAQGTFKMAELVVKANTSKPVTLVYPASSILNKDMDLSSFSIQHAHAE